MRGETTQLTNWIRRARYDARALLEVYPPLYLPLARRRYGDSSEHLLRDDTEFVIEGFMRSGNTFAAEAFTMAQPRPVATAHHLHSAAQVIVAVRRQIPTLLLVRDPVDTVASHVVRYGSVTPERALRHWVRFYERLMPYRDGVVVGPFVEVTSDFGSVIRRVNRRFGTRFAEFDHTEDNVRRCFRRIDERNQQRFGEVVEAKVARPSAARDAANQGARSELTRASLSGLRTHAYGIFADLTKAGDV